MVFTFSVLDRKYPFLGKFGSKLFKIVSLSSNFVFFNTFLDSMVVFTFSVLEWIYYPFWANLIPKNQNRQFNLKLCIKSNSNIEGSMVLPFFLFFV